MDSPVKCRNNFPPNCTGIDVLLKGAKYNPARLEARHEIHEVVEGSGQTHYGFGMF